MRALALVLVFCHAAEARATDIIESRFADPTGRYAHGVLGDAIEWGRLEMRGADGRLYTVDLPDARVFEDVAPRRVDVDGDGLAEVIVVEADKDRGARLVVYDTDGLVAASDYIGTRFRWLAPVGAGAADLDGDGQVEFAFVDRPHLARTLRVLRQEGDALRVVASLPDVTNHRIGERDIAGGIRECGDGPEMILATADWGRVVAVRFDGEGFVTRDLGPHVDRESFETALACEDL